MTIAALMTGVTEKTDQSINQSANAVSESIGGVAGGKDLVRGRAASFASEEDGIAVPISLQYISLLIGFTKMGIAQASEQAFLSKTQSSRIIKMVKFFTQIEEALHQNGTD